ncbi:T-cell surface glycoprotein CD3 gamma chain [Spinachia spinachia]
MEAALSACLLLLWTLTAPVSGDADFDFEVTEGVDGIAVICRDKNKLEEAHSNRTLEYKDSNSKEYECDEEKGPKIFVKFRTCYNCIELDEGSVAGMVVGNVVATLVIGVAVYLVASQTPIGAPSAGNKSSDRQPISPNDMSSPTDDHYQPLQGRQKGLYDQLQGKRGHATPR